MLLITLFFTMGLNGLNIEFSPSARKVGKAISSEFLKTLQATLSTLKDENDLKELMLVYAEKYAFNLVKEPK
jgi:hypothetical protein